MNKVALITGGVRRLGRYISYFLADEGYDLAIIYNSSSKDELNKTKETLSLKNIKFKFYKCDLKNLKELKKNISLAGNEFKRIDVLINNAGIINKIDFEKITPKLFDDTINTNLRAMLFTIQYSLRFLIKSQHPRVINFASLGGFLNWSDYIPYGISKSGVVKLTQMLAKKLAPKIMVNAIAPGTVIIEGEEKGTPAKASIERIPLRKYGNPDDIINAIKYLFTADYVTGQIIIVDGGRIIN